MTILWIEAGDLPACTSGDQGRSGQPGLGYRSALRLFAKRR